jgi:hypothetical protein
MGKSEKPRLLSLGFFFLANAFGGKQCYHNKILSKRNLIAPRGGWL